MNKSAQHHSQNSRTQRFGPMTPDQPNPPSELSARLDLQAKVDGDRINRIVSLLSDSEVDVRLSEMPEQWHEVIRKTTHPTDRRSLLEDIIYVSLP